MINLRLISAAFLKYRLHLVLPVVLAATIVIPPTLQAPYLLYPIQGNEETVSTFDDQDDGGASFASEAIETDSGITFSFVVRPTPTFSSPFVGISFDLLDSLNQNLFDASGYNRVVVDIASPGAHYLTYSLKTNIPGYSKPDTLDSFLNIERRCLVSDTVARMALPFSSFSVPDWWWEINDSLNRTDKAISRPKFSRIFSFTVENTYGTPSGDTVSVQIKRIAFDRDNSLLYGIVLSLLFLYFALLLILRSIKKNRKLPPPQVIIPYREIEIQNTGDEEVARLTAAIAKNYTDSDLTVEKIARIAGLSAAKIPTVLKKHFQMNFKQYLNTIRITEAKRLLAESDLQIVAIAYKVGYNNIPHFNRTFKLSENLSPKGYRKAHNAHAQDLDDESDLEEESMDSIEKSAG